MNDLTSNLGCICSINLDPTMLLVDNNIFLFCWWEWEEFIISAIYASPNFIQRRLLWNNLSNIQLQYNLSWCRIGDFNISIGAHEHKGTFQPTRLPMKDFQDWTDINQLIHLPARGMFFTQTNGRGGNNYAQKTLDISICNLMWIDMCSYVSCSTTIKHIYDHYHLLLDFRFEEIRFASQFRFENVVITPWM